MNSAAIEILHEQGPFLSVLKPAGLLTQAPPGIDSIEVRIKSFLKERDQKPGKVYLGVPHRLDRPVSGVMVFAKHRRAARRLAEQFEARTVSKTYWAFVADQVTPASGTWIDYIRKIPNEARAELVDRDQDDAREAILHYQTLFANQYGTMLKISLETGRTHQIRVQTSSRGHSIWGDQFYGSDKAFGPQYDDPRLQPIALHSRSIGLEHPMTYDSLLLTAPLPSVWSELQLPTEFYP